MNTTKNNSRRRRLSHLMFINLIFFAVCTSQADETETIPALGIHRAEAAIVLDGTRDASYRSSNRTGWVSSNSVVTDEADLSAELYSTWDDAGLYLFVSVKDDVFNQDHPSDAVYSDDSVEFVFDPDNSDHDTDWDGVYDIKVVARRLADGSSEVVNGTFKQLPPGADFTGLDGQVVLTGDGYAAEIFVPWAALQIDPVNDWTMGLGIQINDDDGTDTSDPADGLGDRESILQWGMEGNYNNNTSLMGDLTILASKTAIIGQTGDAIVIDGSVDGAYTAFASMNVLNRWVDQNSPPEGSAIWRATFDAENLYFFVDVTDAAIIAGESANAWEDDGVEIFFDANNSKGGAFDGVDDVKMSFRLTDLTGGLEIITTENFPAPPVGTDFSGLEVVQTTSETGWTLEAKIPWSVIRFTPEPGAGFGFGIDINDNDDGGARDGVLTWSGGSGYNNATQRMGTVRIFDLNETVIASTTETVSLDGDIDAAYGASGWNAIDRRAELPANDNSGYWAATYDATNLYILVDVRDDAIVYDSDASWMDDGIEFFFDPSKNNISGSFDGIEDVKITVGPGAEGIVRLTYLPTEQFPVPPADTDFTGLDAVWVETALGWRVEMQVPWATLRLTPTDGWLMGFDLALMDDDDGEGRDTTLSWSSLGNHNQQTQYYGKVYLNRYPSFSSSIGATSTGDMTYNSWLGQFGEYPSIDWIWHEGFKWLYTGSAQSGTVGYRLYNPALDAWIYMSEELFPYAFVYGTGWVYYAHTDGDAYLYDFSDEQWNAVP